MGSKTATAKISCSKGTTTYQFDGTESSLWQHVGEILKFVPNPDTVTVDVGGMQAMFSIGDYVKLMFNNIKGLEPSLYHKKDLRKVDENNSYNFYKIVPLNMGNQTISCTGSYGRIGADKTDLNAEQVIKPYPACMFWIRYYEKLHKGYIDVSDEIVDEEEDRKFSLRGMVNISPSAIKDPSKEIETPAMQLFRTLSEASRNVVTEQFDVTFLAGRSPFTQKQIDSCWEIWKCLGKSRNVDEFNSRIRKLLALSPRRIDPYRGMTVKSFYAKKAATDEEQQAIYAAIIDREESLIRAMESVTFTAPETKERSEGEIFPGITIEEGSKEDKEKVLGLIGDGDSAYLKKKLRKVWRITPIEQEKIFNSYVKANDIKEKKLLFHGSKTENWLSIIRYSLMLNPNAQITGKMFGHGIYFAPSADKSYGYTSGGRWNNNGKTPTVYMGIYETAYGNPYHPNGPGSYTASFLKEHHKDCVHARSKDTGLCRDEIIFYDESALCIRYLCEFE